jgi:hypothetical protein
MAFGVAKPNAGALRAINYSPFAEHFRRHASRSAPRLRDLVSSAGASFGAVFTRIDCEPAFGVDLMSQVDVFAAEPACRAIRRDSMPHPERHLVSRGQILVAAAGQMGETTLFGRCMIADGRLSGKYLGPDVFALSFHDEAVDAKYAYAFLASRFGVDLLRSAAYGTSIPRLRRDLLLDLPVPRAEPAVERAIVALVDGAMLAREKFAQELADARRPIECLPEMREATESCARRRARAGVHSGPFPTLTGKTFVAAGDALPILRGAWRDTIGDVVPETAVFGGSLRFRTPCKPPHGIEFLTQRDVFLFRPVPQRIAHPGFDDRGIFVRPGTLIVGGAGTLGEGEIFGRAVYASEGMSRFAITQDMLRIVPEEGAEPMVFAFLSTLVGRRLLRSTGAGTKLLRMRADLIRALPLPSIDTATKDRVSAHLTAAMQARDAAERGEAEAIRLIETEVIPAWLN